MSVIRTSLIEHDTFPLTMTYTVKGVGPIDITGYSFALKIAYDAANGGPRSISGTPLDQTDVDNLGKFVMHPAAGDLINGTWEHEVMVVYPDTTERTLPLGGIHIAPRIV